MTAARILGIDVALYLIGDFVPQELGSHFEVEPHIAVLKGTERRNRITGESRGIHHESTWGCSSATAILSDDIDEHVAWLIKKGASAKGLTGKYAHAFIEVRIQCGTSCVLPESLLGFARDLNASIGLVARTSNVT